MAFFSQDESIEAWREEPIERPSLGYKLHSEEKLICASCKKELVSIIIVKLDCPIFHEVDSDVDIVKFIANCPSCKSKSFVKTFNRVKLYFKSIDPFVLNDTILTGTGKERRCEIKLQ